MTKLKNIIPLLLKLINGEEETVMTDVKVSLYDTHGETYNNLIDVLITKRWRSKEIS